MFSDTTYISLGISPGGDGIVLQPMVPDGYRRALFPCTAFISELDSRGRSSAIRFIGGFLLSGMKAFFPIVNTYADELITHKVEPLTSHVSDHSGRKRELHLRIHAINENRSVVIRRFNNDDACGDDPPPVMLKPLMAVGPEEVAAVVGELLLAELAALHPDVFSQFPALAFRREDRS